VQFRNLIRSLSLTLAGTDIRALDPPHLSIFPSGETLLPH